MSQRFLRMMPTRTHNSIWDIVFGETIRDPKFGKVVLNTGSSHRYWTASVNFRPTESEVTLYFFHLDRTIPDRLKSFYVEIEDNFHTLREKISNQLQRTFSLEFRSDLVPQNSGAIKFDGVSLPTDQELINGKFEWEIYFTFQCGDSIQAYSVEMQNWKVGEIYAD